MFAIVDPYNKPLIKNDINKIASSLWGTSPAYYPAAPNETSPSWDTILIGVFYQLPTGDHTWAEVIGKICETIALGQSEYASFNRTFLLYEPYIRLCLKFEELGLVLKIANP